MSSNTNTLFMQITPEALPSPISELVNAPALISICCACGLVQNEAGAIFGHERWVTQQTYHKIHGVSPADQELTHTYCPKCFEKFQETVRQFFGKTG